MDNVIRAQEKLDALEGLDNKALLERAWNEIRLLCGSDSRPKKWTMTIPVDADRDSDILFGEVLKRFAMLEVEIVQLRKDCTPFQAQIDQRKTYQTLDESLYEQNQTD